MANMRIDEIFNEVRDERIRQDMQWGGADHDDDHTANTDGAFWGERIRRQVQIANNEHAVALGTTDALSKQRARYVKMAALAIAGIESLDRLMDDICDEAGS